MVQPDSLLVSFENRRVVICFSSCDMLRGHFVHQTDSSCKNFVKKVNVKASSEIRKWKVLSNNRSLPYSLRYLTFKIKMFS